MENFIYLAILFHGPKLPKKIGQNILARNNIYRHAKFHRNPDTIRIILRTIKQTYKHKR